MILLFLRRSSLKGDSWSMAMAEAALRRNEQGGRCCWCLGGIEAQSRAVGVRENEAKEGWAVGSIYGWMDGQVAEPVLERREEELKKVSEMGNGASVNCVCVSFLSSQVSRPSQTKSSSFSSPPKPRINLI